MDSMKYPDWFNPQALEGLDQRLAVVRDRVCGVARQYATGFYLHGRPGTAKTFTVRKILDGLRVPYHYHDGHLTPMGLFDLLEEQFDRVIVLDDVSEIFRQPVALQLLLAALGNQRGGAGVRLVRYRRQGRVADVTFSGGIIFISNLELTTAPLLQAIKSRVNVLQYSPTDRQIAALMGRVCSGGWPVKAPQVTPAECFEVATHVIKECERRDCRLDMRLLVDKALPDFTQWRNGDTEADWRDLVTATIEEQVTELKHALRSRPQTRQEKTESEEELVRTLMTEFSNDRKRMLVAWRERTTGKSDRAFDRRLQTVRHIDSLSKCRSVDAGAEEPGRIIKFTAEGQSA